MKRKLFVLGLDCADYHRIKKWMEQGYLPTFQKFNQRGVLGLLNSCLPRNSASSWTTILSGVTPAKHGIFSWSEKHPISGKTIAEKLDTQRIPMLWNIVNSFGYSFGGGGFPLNYPISPLNGFMIPGDDIPRKNIRDFGYPCNIHRIMKEKYNIVFSLQPRYKYDIEYCQSIIQFHNERMDYARKLVHEYPCDIYFFVFTLIDYAEHYGLNSEELLRVYVAMDESLAIFLNECVNNNDTVVILSDHGGININRVFAVDKWLHSLGLLQYNPSLSEIDEVKVNYILEKLRTNNKYPMSKKRDETTKYIANLWRTLDNNVKADLTKFLQKYTDEGNTKELIDWKNTYAFSSGLNNSIYINSVDRFSDGIVRTDKQKKSLISQIKNELKRVIDPETQLPFIKNVWEGSILYKGAFCEKAADIYFEMEHENTIALSYGFRGDGEKYLLRDVYPPYAGNHTYSGFYAMMGPQIANLSDCPVLRKEDVLPNILSLMSIPIATYLDGSIYPELFNRKGTDSFVEAYDNCDDWQLETTLDDNIILNTIEQLKDMGYMR